MNPDLRTLHADTFGAELRARADANRPADSTALAEEVRRLRGLGLTARDVAAALRLDLAFVLTTLGEQRA